MAAHPQLTVDASDELTKDTVFSVLSNQRRRQVLRCLREDGPDGSNIRDLSRRIAAWENGITLDELTYKQRKRVYTSLHQTHLPKLDDIGVVEYDRDRGTVVLTDRATVLDEYLLDDTVERTVPWPRLYLSIAVGGAAVLALRWLEAPLVSAVPELAVCGAVVAAVAVAAGVHAAYERGLHRDGSESETERSDTNRE